LYGQLRPIQSTIALMKPEREELLVRGGAKLQKIRERLGLSIREVQRLSQQVVQERQNRDFYLSRAWLRDVERGRLIPGIFKIETICRIYGLTVVEVHAFFGINPGDITKDQAVFRAPKTHLLTPPDELILDTVDGASGEQPELRLEKTNLVTRLVDIWGDVPVPLLRQLNLRRSLYGYIGTQDRTMSPLLPPGTFVQIDTKQTRVKQGPSKQGAGQSQFARPIYFLDIRTGYACGWCEIKDGQLILIPHPDSGEQTRAFRYPDEVDIVGRVIGVAAMRITEEGFTPIDQTMRRNPPKQ
jgi:transcriptional regulator with XRE-family HTH domain